MSFIEVSEHHRRLAAARRLEAQRAAAAKPPEPVATPHPPRQLETAQAA